MSTRLADLRQHELSAAAVLQLAAHRTCRYDFTVWFWGDAIALDGLLESAELTEDALALEHATRSLRHGVGSAPSWVDHLVPAHALLRLARMSDDRDLLTTATNLAHWLTDVVPHVDGKPLYRPDQPNYRHTVWVDSIYHVPVFLVALGFELGRDDLIDDGVSCWANHVDALRPSDQPFLAHSYDTGAGLRHGCGWARGSGWALLGMADTLPLIPRGHPSHARAESDFRALAAAVLERQDAGGLWRTLLHDREAYLETSAAAMFGAAFTAGVRAGILQQPYATSAERAWEALLPRIDDDGSLWGVSACTYAGVSNLNDDAMYKTLPTETNVWGQGGIMRFAAERIRSGLP
jgi:unsaturated rhamnogalacturonyl hydrolase